MSLCDLTHEDENDDGYLLPFGKISKRARRFDELESQKCSQICEDDENYFSQDLFHSQTDDSYSMVPDTMERFCRYSPSTILDIKTKKDATAHIVELPRGTFDQQTLISGYQGVKVCRGQSDISSVIQSNAFEALPHPAKLFRRQKKIYGHQMTNKSKRSLRVQQHDKDNQSVAIHLKQLRLKQSRIDANKESEQTNLTDQTYPSQSTSKASTSAMTSHTMKQKSSITASISDWETIESWIHGRWKSHSGQPLNQHVQEE
ncbi:uncharacterized protein LOC132553638 [Ylistrum balloti]|uniref:uncharacterized protein LOC132553638 n=1 Tax=Ylistrum balloti TaxID=509963 RepID=UPI002905E020|nr:uncharacterized protein LOC132553638 [Ylistrum balloti]